MKKFTFRLANVQRVRRIQEDQTRLKLMEANRYAHETAAKVDARLYAYLALPRAVDAMPLGDFERMRFEFEAAATAVEAARIEHREALDRVDAARLEWLEAKQRVTALEKLEERHRAEHAIDLRRGEDRLIDDLVVARHRIRNQQEIAR